MCPIVFTLAQHDGESYVRASALNCLTEMVRNIPVFWDECLINYEIVPYLMDMLYTESEGVVRREGVVLLTAIYERKKLAPHKDNLDRVFSVMAYCAVNDLYWEVKTNALKFWKEVACVQFQHQGVLDNTFPAVTFSKEHKKIVHLTQKEILRRLKEILDELEVRGCLGILLRCLDDTSDLEVVKVATTVVQRLQSFLDRYHYMDEVILKEKSDSGAPKDQSLSPVMDTNFIRERSSRSGGRNNADLGATSRLSSGSSTPTQTMSDAEAALAAVTNGDVDGVIEAIVEAQDVNLLAHAYENQLQVDAAKEAEGEGEKRTIPDDYYKEFASVTAEQFLRRVYGLDLDKRAEERATWIEQIENFESLLDDILLGFEDRAVVNDADCY